jgi:hypothetical protein
VSSLDPPLVPWLRHGTHCRLVSSFHGSAVERTALEAPPPDLPRHAPRGAASMSMQQLKQDGRRSLPCSGFPGRAWEPVRTPSFHGSDMERTAASSPRSMAPPWNALPHEHPATQTRRQAEPAMQWVGGSASRPQPPSTTWTCIHEHAATETRRQAEPATQWVPRQSLGTSTTTSAQPLVPWLRRGTHCLGGSASRTQPPCTTRTRLPCQLKWIR